MKALKKILSVAFDIIIWLVIITAATITVISLSSSKDGVASIFGYVPLSIQTNSMEPTIMTGDLIITKSYDGKTQLEEDQIISYFSIEQEKKIIKTHRIVSANNINGMIYYTTQGDNNPEPDTINVAPGDIISIYEGSHYANLGKALTFLKGKVGFFVCIILPLAAFFVYQLYKFIMLLIDYKKAK